MDHILILRHTDIVEYATKLLAMRGVKPASPIIFKPRKGHPGEFEAHIECESTDLPDHCPQCGVRLGQGPVLAPVPAGLYDPPPAAQPSPNVTALTPVPPLDPNLGESMDPPGEVESHARGGSTHTEAEGMSSLVAASRQLEAQLARERNQRPPTGKPRR